MARAHRLAIIASVFTTIYFLAYFAVLPVPFVDEERVRQILPVIPWWMLVSFGSWSLWTLGWGLLTFPECPDAYNELLGDIAQAKDDLREKGVTVD